MDGSLDIGRVLSRGFQTIANQFPVFAALAILFAGVPAVLLPLLIPSAANPALALAAFFGFRFWIYVLISVLFHVILQAVLVRASILDLRSEPVEIGPVLGDALSLILPLIGLSILMTIAIAFGMVLFLVPGIILYCMWIVAVPVLVGERRGVFASMERSAELTKGSRWWIFLLLIIYFFVAIVISLLNGAIIGLTGAGSIVSLVASLIVSSLIGMITAVMVASLYIELRVLKEGGATGGLAEIFA